MHFSRNDSCFAFARSVAFFLFFPLLANVAPSAAVTVSQADAACAAATLAPLNHKLVGELTEAGQIGLFRLEIPSPGLLDLETTDLREGTGTTVVFLGARCRMDGAGERGSDRHHLIEVSKAGSYYAAVRTTSSAAADQFALQVGFAPGLDARAVEVAGSRLNAVAPPPETKGDDLDELVLDPGGNFIYVPSDLRFSLLNPLSASSDRCALDPTRPPETKGDDLDELVLDPGGNFIYTPLNMRFSLLNPFSEKGDDLDELVLDPGHRSLPQPPSAPGTSYSIRYVPVAVCPTSDLDDHGDTLGCATELALGSRLDAAINAQPTGDQDAFTFALKQRSSVVLEASAEIETEGTLLDAAGATLAQDDGGPRGGFRIEATLEPGRYYLRIGSRADAQGPYQLRFDAAAIGR